jgi:DNA polymerase
MSFDRQAALDLLAFYVESGVDIAIGDAPVDRLAEPALAPPIAAPAPAGAPAERPARSQSTIRTTLPPKLSEIAKPAPVAPPSPDAAAMAAREAARRAQTLDELRAIMNSFEGCGLRATAKQLVFADGNPAARIMFVGEAPGRDEDLAGLPFVGRSGKLLDLMLKAIGLDRSGAYIANIIPWRPPGNRDPSVQETQICLPFIQRQIELVSPDVLVCLGKPSAQTLLGLTDGIKRIRGRWISYKAGDRDLRAIATFHPAYLLRSPLEKRWVWRDLLMIKNALG